MTDIPAPAARFTHLHTHTEFSMLDGLGKVEHMCAAAAADGQTAIAMTDHGRLNGAWRFRNAAKEHGLKPIFGVEAYLAIGSRHEQNVREEERDEGDYGDYDEALRGKKQSSTKTVRYEHLTILARNETGWFNLVAMQNKAQESYWYHPRIDYDLLKEHGEGLIVLTGCLAGPVAGRLKHDLVDEAADNIRRLIDCVGRENVYVEIMEHNIAIEAKVLTSLVTLAQGWTDENGNPDPLDMVVTNDAHYVDCEHGDAHDAWLAVQSGSKVADVGRFAFNGEGYHLRTETEMRALHDTDWWQTACDNTMKVAARCDDDVLTTPGRLLPQYPVPEEFGDANKYFRHLLAEGAKARYGIDPQTGRLPEPVRDRLNMEYKVITEAGFADYFLIVWDLIDWANSDLGQPEEGFPRGKPGEKTPILTGPGRGSAAGSICAYVMGITNLCPLEHDLLFERFLEPGRADMPDMDLDFAALRRDDVLEYLNRRWGRKNVSRIGSFASMKSRAALTRAGQVHELPREANTLKKLIPIKSGAPIPLHTMFDPTETVGKDFREEVESASTPDVDTMLAHARVWEDTVSGEGQHACGILVAPRTLTDLIPIRYDRAKGHATDENGKPSTMISLWDSRDVEAYGLLKLDVLGLDNLDFMAACFEFIQLTRGETLTAANIPDPSETVESVTKTWEMLQEGRTAGVFQLDSDEMTKLVKDMRVSCFEDLSAAVALYRPGPLSADLDKRYVQRKAGLEPVDYNIFTKDKTEQELLATVLDETFGVPIYQEQLMRLGGVMAGFDAPSRSKLRKAVAKKDKAMMAEVGARFIAESQQVQYNEDGTVFSPAFKKSTAETMWETFKGSADYLFNKSHSAAYGLLSYYTAWLKANYPVEYGAAILAVSKKADKRFITLRELESVGIEVLQPDVNYSLASTAPEIGDDEKATGRIRLGLAEIKGVGDAGNHVARERLENGRYVTLGDMVERVKIVDPNGVQADKKLSVSAVEGLIEAGACDSFGPRLGLLRVARATAVKDLDVPVGELPPVFRSMLQRERLGIAVGEHPLRAVGGFLKEYVTPVSVDRFGNPMLGRKPSPVRPDAPAGTALLLGVLSSWEVIVRQKGRFVSFTLEGTRGVLTGNVWYQAYADMVASGRPLPRVGDVVCIEGFVKVEEVVRQAEASDDELETGDETGSVPQKMTVHTLVASRIWAVDIPFTPERYPMNTFGGTMTVSAVNTGASLAALSAAVTPSTPVVGVRTGTLSRDVEAGVLGASVDVTAPPSPVTPVDGGVGAENGSAVAPDTPSDAPTPESDTPVAHVCPKAAEPPIISGGPVTLFAIRDEREKFTDMVGYRLLDVDGRRAVHAYVKYAPPGKPFTYVLTNSITDDLVVWVVADHLDDHDPLVAQMEQFVNAGNRIALDDLNVVGDSKTIAVENGVVWTMHPVEDQQVFDIIDAATR